MLRKIAPRFGILKTMIVVRFWVAIVFCRFEKCQNIRVNSAMGMGCCVGTGTV
jgi:hypothetical protein